MSTLDHNLVEKLCSDPDLWKNFVLTPIRLGCRLGVPVYWRCRALDAAVQWAPERGDGSLKETDRIRLRPWLV